MKKILIASSCAILLCFTSCASKQAPESEVQIEDLATESTETEENSSEENNQADAEENSPEDTETQADEESIDENDSLTSEDFPEPEIIEEPEIITLEAPVEPEPSENEPASEEVKNEEPPEITVVNSNEENQTAESEVSEETGEEKEDLSETSEAPSQEEDKDLEDITANDVVIVSKQDSDGISGGIDITDDDSDSDANLSDIEKDITPSRSVTLKKFEYLDVTYPGSGWIYMGLTDNSKDLAYFGRKLGTKDTKFSLQARAAGTKIIHFYRNDPLTGQYLDDYVEVIIQAENGSNKTHIEAPEYKLPVQKKIKPAIKATEEETPENTEEKEADKKTEALPSANAAKAPVKAASSPAVTEKAAAQTSTTNNSTSAAKENVNAVETQASQAEAANTIPAANPDSLLKEAQVLYNEKEYSAALNKLNNFLEYSTDNGDEALYLKGQILEAKSDVRDIKGAIDAYTTLTKNYPASKLWDSANKRIIYLKRFYLEVR